MPFSTFEVARKNKVNIYVQIWLGKIVCSLVHGKKNIKVIEIVFTIIVQAMTGLIMVSLESGIQSSHPLVGVVDM